MSDYESDDEVLGQTSVLLGFAGKEISRKSLTIHDNHIGGMPIWLNDTPAPKELTSCSVCKEPMGLLAQLSCPLNDKLYDRVIYVLSCPRPECHQKEGTVKAIRGVHDSQEVRERILAELKEDEAPAVQSKKHDVGDMIFGGASSSANPFAGSNPFATQSQEPEAPRPAETAQPKQKKTKANANKTQANKTQASAVEEEKGVWLQKAVEVDDEYLAPEKPVRIEELDSGVMETADSSSGADSIMDPEAAAIVETVSDPTFTKFASLVQHNPDQILRYERPLQIVPYSDDELYRVLINPVEIPETANGDKRNFELQLMPHLISELETDEQLLDGMEWGTIAVATSENDEFPALDENGVGYVEEWVAVQWELKKI